MRVEQPQTETLHGLKVLWKAPIAPLVVPPALEPVVYSMPNDQRKSELETYLTEIGRPELFVPVWAEVENYNPLSHDSYERQGYTKEQRLWVKYKRDESKDQAPYPHITPETQSLMRLYGIQISEPFQLQLHHIWAQAYLQAFLGLTDHPELISPPENGITLTKLSHVGPYIPNVNESRHNDVYLASTLYRQGDEAFKRIFDSHWKMAQNGIKYWLSADDSQLFEIARERTRKMYEARDKRRQHGKAA